VRVCRRWRFLLWGEDYLQWQQKSDEAETVM
jgi:hypothetical protein